MKRASISEAKNSLSAYLADVRRGESVLITDRGEPVAILTPVPAVNEEEALRSLVNQGIVRPPLSSRPKKLRLPGPIKVSSPTIALEILSADRED